MDRFELTVFGLILRPLGVLHAIGLRRIYIVILQNGLR